MISTPVSYFGSNLCPKTGCINVFSQLWSVRTRHYFAQAHCHIRSYPFQFMWLITVSFHYTVRATGSAVKGNANKSQGEECDMEYFTSKFTICCHKPLHQLCAGMGSGNEKVIQTSMKGNATVYAVIQQLTGCMSHVLLLACNAVTASTSRCLRVHVPVAGTSFQSSSLQYHLWQKIQRRSYAPRNETS